MRSGTSFFNVTIYKKNLQRYWPVWVTYLISLLLSLTVPIYNYIRRRGSESFEYLSEDILRHIDTFGVIFVAGFAILAAMAVYSYLYNARSASFYHALPVKREGLFLTHYFSGLTFLLLPTLLSFATTYLVQLLSGYTGGIDALLQWLGTMSIMAVFFFSFATLCAYLTGHILALPILYGILNFTAVVVEYMICIIMQFFIYGLSSWAPVASPLSPIYHIMSNIVTYKTIELADGTYTTVTFVSWSYFLCLLAVGIVFAAICMLLHRIRRVESASDLMAVPQLKPVFKYCFSTGCALVLGCLLFAILFDDNPYLPLGLIPCVLIGGLIGYLASEMLMRKTFRVFSKSWKGFVAFACAILALFACFHFDVFGVETLFPEAEDVKYAEIYSSNTAHLTEDVNEIREIIKIHQLCVARKEENRAFEYDDHAGYVKEDDPWCTRSISIFYAMKNGDTLERRYTIPVTETLLQDQVSPIAALTAFFNSPNVLQQRTLPDTDRYIPSMSLSLDTPYVSQSLDVDPAHSAALMEAVIADIMAGKAGKFEPLPSYYYKNSDELSHFNLSIFFVYPEEEIEQEMETIVNKDHEATVREVDTRSSHLSITLTPECVNINRFLEQHGYFDKLEEMTEEHMEQEYGQKFEIIYAN